jgi:hypothetical protein
MFTFDAYTALYPAANSNQSFMSHKDAEHNYGNAVYAEHSSAMQRVRVA